MVIIETAITPDNIAKELQSDVEDFHARFMMKFVRLIPVKIRERLDNGKPSGRLYRRRGGASFQRFHKASARGEAPAKDTGALYRSLKSRMLSEKEGEISLAGHARYLDPLLDGYLNRPFIESGIDAAFEEVSGQI